MCPVIILNKGFSLNQKNAKFLQYEFGVLSYSSELNHNGESFSISPL